MLERARVLPEVVFLKEASVRVVDALAEPADELVERSDRRLRLAFEDPVEPPPGAIAIECERRLEGQPSPRVANGEQAQSEVMQRPLECAEQSVLAACGYFVPALAATGSDLRSCSRRSQTVESRASFGANV